MSQALLVEEKFKPDVKNIEAISDQKKYTKTEKQCFKCGKSGPHKSDCPAMGKRCSNCDKKNQFAKICRLNTKINSKNTIQTKAIIILIMII